MKCPRFLLLLLIPVLFAGCATVSRRDREVLRAHDVPPDVYDKMMEGDPLSLSNVITLSERGVPPGLIINYMDDTDTAYRLRKADVKLLRADGVDEQVIAYMLSTGAPYGPVAYPGGAYPGYAAYPAGPYAAPYYPYYYDDYYGGPIILGGGYYRGRGWGGRGWGGGGGWGHHR
jgi:hypothetical protein